MISKLCYLFTFIFSVTNLLGATSLGWGLVFAPSMIAIGLKLLIIMIAFILACIANK